MRTTEREKGRGRPGALWRVEPRPLCRRDAQAKPGAKPPPQPAEKRASAARPVTTRTERERERENGKELGANQGTIIAEITAMPVGNLL